MAVSFLGARASRNRARRRLGAWKTDMNLVEPRQGSPGAAALDHVAVWVTENHLAIANRLVGSDEVDRLPHFLGPEVRPVRGEAEERGVGLEPVGADAFPGAMTGAGGGAGSAGLQQLAVLEEGGQARKRVPGEGKQGSGRAVGDRDADPPRTGQAVRLLLRARAAVGSQPYGEGEQGEQEDAREHPPGAPRFPTVL